MHSGQPFTGSYGPYADDDPAAWPAPEPADGYPSGALPEEEYPSGAAGLDDFPPAWDPEAELASFLRASAAQAAAFQQPATVDQTGAAVPMYFPEAPDEQTGPIGQVPHPLDGQEVPLPDGLGQSVRPGRPAAGSPYRAAPADTASHPPPEPHPSPAPQPHTGRPHTTRLSAAAAPGSPRHKHRRRLFRAPAVPWVRLLSLLAVCFTALVVGLMSTLGGMVSYNPLRALAATGTPPGLARLWPLLVYGPWVVASVSILRAALHRRRAAHSWAVVVLFSGIAGMLCVVQAPKTLPGIAVTVLPALTVLVSFHQFVRQITLTAPARHALPRRSGFRAEGR